MQVYAINGSPRKKWNTHKVLESALDGVKEVDGQANTEIINLYDYNYQGCKSCFACKLIGGPSYGKCVVKDDIAPILRKLMEADIIIFGSPIYFGEITGMLRSFMERLLFPAFVYDKDFTSLAPKKVHTGFIYTMNVTEVIMKTVNYPEVLDRMRSVTGHLFGYKSEVQYVNNTYQFSDYSKYMCTAFSEKEKAEYREKHFPIDCKKAAEMGAALAKAVQAESK